MRTLAQPLALVLPLALLILGCAGTGERTIPPAPDDDDDSAASSDDDDSTPLPKDLHGTQPSSPLPLPQFAALNYDGADRGPDNLRGQPTVLWFFPFAGTPL